MIGEMGARNEFSEVVAFAYEKISNWNRSLQLQNSTIFLIK